MKEVLKKISFFKDFSEEELEELSKICILRTYEKDEILFYEGENSEYLHLLIKGNLKIYKVNSKGVEIVLHRFNAMNFVAELANYANIAFPASAKFLSTSSVIKIHFQSLKDRFLNKTSFVLTLLSALSQKLIYMSDFVHNEMILSAEAKLAKLLCEQSELFASIKHNQLASFINIAPETFSRLLAKLKNDDIIEINNKQVIIKDMNYLKSLYEG